MEGKEKEAKKPNNPCGHSGEKGPICYKKGGGKNEEARYLKEHNAPLSAINGQEKKCRTHRSERKGEKRKKG